MLQNPKIAFRDPKLQQCRIEMNLRRQPRPWAGAFAVVYKGLDAGSGEPFAIRVFTTESPERRERYEQISAYLKDRKLKCLCDFEYRDRAIRSAGDGKWYPMIIMQWVQGETLFAWVRARCLAADASALSLAARGWIEVIGELNEMSVVHGDLQHGNVMVDASGQIKLVDYDCLCVPSLIGRRNLEVGVEPYQHPARDASTLLSLDLDNFSAVMIYVGLRALAADPGLWMEHIEPDDYDKLLFRAEDFRSPDTSALCHDLARSPDREVRELTRQLIDLYNGPMDRVPPLGHLTNSFGKLEQLLAEKRWEEAVQILNRRGQFRDAPEHLKPLIQQAYQRVCLKQSWAEFQKLPRETSGPNDRKLVEAWNEPLFAGHERAERQRVRVAEARRRVAALDRVTYLVQQSAGKASVGSETAIVKAAAGLPEGYQYNLRKRVEGAKRRVAVMQRLKALVDDPAVEAALVAAWRAVQEAKCEGLVKPAWRKRIELAEGRAPILKKLHNLPGDLPLDQRDKQIVELWDVKLLANCREAEPYRTNYETAMTRGKLLPRLEKAIEENDETAVGDLIQHAAFDGYPLPDEWTEMVESVRSSFDRGEALLAALQEQRRSAFHSLFDARVIRRRAEEFAPYESLLLKWTSQEVIPLERLGLRPTPGGKSLAPVRMSAGQWRARWEWPEERFCSECVLAVCRGEPDASGGPNEQSVHYRVSVDRASWDSAREIRTEADWEGGYVTVWAIVDLGFRTFYSPPLVLGCLEGRGGWGLKGLPFFSSRE